MNIDFYLRSNFAMQSSLRSNSALHVAMIMDGNGRWATGKGLPRAAGHRAGLQSARHIIEAAPTLGIKTLTLFAFSSDNWRRPVDEVGALMSLARTYLQLEQQRLIEAGIRLTVLGRRDRVPARLRQAIDRVETSTAGGRGLHLRIALDYSSRDAIIRAAASWPSATIPTREQFGRLVSMADQTDCAAEVDLLIRTGGEKRLSDFLLWESAYAELWFSDKLWPDFETDDLHAALADFHRRERRYGGLASVA